MKPVSATVGSEQQGSLSILIIGAGLAGLTCAILLQKNGYRVTVIEKKQFPFHRVCGEYVSNEVLPFLTSLNLDIQQFNPSKISKLIVSSTSGKSLEMPLQMGGFGLSRYVFDEYLYQEARSLGVEFVLAKANDIRFANEHFTVNLSTGTSLTGDLALAAYGKRSNLDQKLNRRFFYQRSPFMGVKYHIKTDMANDLIRLDNFKGGYGGTCKIEDDLYNLCYLTETKNLKLHGSIAGMEQDVLFKNPHLKQIFNNSEFVFEKPEVINEISFEKKQLVEDHILFCGDSAGMITPLCGNGMAMAIHSGKTLADCIIQNGKVLNTVRRLELERNYTTSWESKFSIRLKAGRNIQKLFLNFNLSSVAVGALRNSTFLSNLMVRSTHGESF